MLRPEFVRDKFSDTVESLFKITYEKYSEYEERVIDDTIQEDIRKLEDRMYTRDEVEEIAMKEARHAIQMEKSLKQSRASRAGKSFEIIVQNLLGEIGIKCERITRGDKKVHLRRIDLVIPDKKTAIESPDRAHFLSLKTSLKERWKQVAEEQEQGQRTHLLTLLQREVISNAVAHRITGHAVL